MTSLDDSTSLENNTSLDDSTSLDNSTGVNGHDRDLRAPDGKASAGTASAGTASAGTASAGTDLNRIDPDAPELPDGVDQVRVARAVREILEAIGEDADRDGLRDTPERVARMFAETCSGLHEEPDRHLKVTFDAGHDEMIMVRDIPLYSMCEHHLVPFSGHAHVAYIPNVDGRVTGLSKVARLVEGYAHRPQVQERLTTQVADAIESTLQPRGVLVVIEAEHLCMSMRGVRKPGTSTVTSAVRGIFRDDVSARMEAMQFIDSGRHR